MTPGADEQARVHLAGHAPRDQHREQRADAARRRQEAGLEHGIAIQILQQRRQKCEPSEQQHAGHRHEDDAHREVAVGEDGALEQRSFGSEHVDQEHPSGADREPGFDDDFPAREPVLLLAAVEAHLQGGKSDREQRETEHVEPAVMSFGLRHEPGHDQDAQDADRKVDQEHPAPVVIVGQPAAEHRPEDRPDHDAAAEQRHRLAVLLARVDVEQRRLGRAAR